jgi:hypothetical protein
MEPVRPFESFTRLGDIPIQNIMQWLGPKANLTAVSNYFGNRILYPTIVAETPEEMAIDLAILREAIKLNAAAFYNTNQKVMTIPETLQEYFGSLATLCMVWIDAFRPAPSGQIVTPGTPGKTLGSVIRLVPKTNPATIEISVNDHKYSIQTGVITVLPIQSDHYDVIVHSPEVTFMEKQDVAVELKGGSVGLIIDSRNN